MEIRYLVDGAQNGGLGLFEIKVPAGARLTPDVGERFFREVAVLAGAGGPPDRVKLAEVTNRYGLVPAMPKQAPRVANGQSAS